MKTMSVSKRDQMIGFSHSIMNATEELYEMVGCDLLPDALDILSTVEDDCTVLRALLISAVKDAVSNA